MKKICCWRNILPIVLVIAFYFNSAAQEQKIELSKNSKALCVITVAGQFSPTLEYASSELKKYLDQITGTSFQAFTKQQAPTMPSIQLEVRMGKNDEDYSIAIEGKNIILRSNSDRAILYAVYDLLHRLGCAWLAPDYSFYAGKAEFVPYKPHLVFSTKNTIAENPRFVYRKLAIEEGRTHDTATLKKLIEWMPKVRYNTLMVPANLNNNGRVRWDKWSEVVSPELKKRGLLLEVGGHGYQNFINAKMEDGQLFAKHPEWFGKDSACNYTSSDRLVFNTTNRDAVDYFLKNILAYVKQHPEINIFEIWPPDVGRWADCADWKKYGTVADRQAMLANQVDSALKTINKELRLEIIAYSFALLPPVTVNLNPDIIVDICPINQSFEYQIADPSSVNNAEYTQAIGAWRKKFTGRIGLYSYYRKYAWRSAPNVIPRYIQRDMQWYASVPMQGISTYAEPGDWFTYELNHYVLAQVAWDPEGNLDSLFSEFFRVRYGAWAKEATDAYAKLEQIVPVYGSIPFTKLKSVEAIAGALKTIRATKTVIEDAMKRKTALATNFSRLLLMYTYAEMDLQIQYSLASKTDTQKVNEQIKTLVAFLEANVGKGVFLLTGDNDFARFTKKYGLTRQSLLD